MTSTGWVVLIVIGVLAGLLATFDHLFGREMPGRWVVGMIAGLAGAYLGGMYSGRWAWMLGDFNIVGSIAGAIIVSHVVELFGRQLPETTLQR